MKPVRCPIFALLTLVLLLLPTTLSAHEPDFSQDFNRAGCTFSTTGSNLYLPLWPGLSVKLAGEEEDDGETLEVESVVTVLSDTELVDGVLTRVVEERESEDGELVEVSRNFMAHCRETGDVWYFGEDVDDYEDGEIVGHGGAWRAGLGGAKAGIVMLGSPVLGARYYQEVAPDVAEDRGEVVGVGGETTVPAGTFTNVLSIVDTDALSPSSANDKRYAPGIGNIKDDELELVEFTLPPCQPNATTHCLQNGRFKVTADWETAAGAEGDAKAILASADSGEFWFFNAGNTEILVKVLNGCGVNNRYWVFAAGLTNVGVTITVEDTESGEEKEYENDVQHPFAPVLDTSAFATCP